MTSTVVFRLVLLLFTVMMMPLHVVNAQQSSSYQVLKTLEHDPTYFTQGLEKNNGLLFESSGRYGKSKIRKYPPDTDQALLEVPIADEYFAEGLTLLNEELFVLTWKENTLLVLDPDTLKIKRKHRYDGQGWGLANDGTQLWMSDGSSTVYARNTDTFKIESEIQVHYQQHAVQRINELEYAEDHLWANIWGTPTIVKIKPANGEVVAFYDLTDLAKLHTSGRDDRVLNGISYDSELRAYWVTGKLWPKRYLIRFE